MPGADPGCSSCSVSCMVLIKEKRENVVELQYFSKFFSNIIYIILLEFHKLQMTKKWRRGGNRKKKFSACARLSKLDGGAELFCHNFLHLRTYTFYYSPVRVYWRFGVWLISDPALQFFSCLERFEKTAVGLYLRKTSDLYSPRCSLWS